VVSLGTFSLVPPTEPCALRSTQPLKVSTRYFSWGKGGRCVWLTTYHPCSAETSRKSGALIYPEPVGPPRPVAGHLFTHSVGGLIGHRAGVYGSSEEKISFACRDSNLGLSSPYRVAIPTALSLVVINLFMVVCYLNDALSYSNTRFGDG